MDHERWCACPSCRKGRDPQPSQEELIRDCGKYAGGGFFIHPDASNERPSVVLHAPEVRKELLRLLDEERGRFQLTEEEQATVDEVRALPEKTGGPWPVAMRLLAIINRLAPKGTEQDVLYSGRESGSNNGGES